MRATIAVGPAVPGGRNRLSSLRSKLSTLLASGGRVVARHERGASFVQASRYRGARGWPSLVRPFPVFSKLTPSFKTFTPTGAVPSPKMAASTSAGLALPDGFRPQAERDHPGAFDREVSHETFQVYLPLLPGRDLLMTSPGAVLLGCGPGDDRLIGPQKGLHPVPELLLVPGISRKFRAVVHRALRLARWTGLGGRSARPRGASGRRAARGPAARSPPAASEGPSSSRSRCSHRLSTPTGSAGPKETRGLGWIALRVGYRQSRAPDGAQQGVHQLEMRERHQAPLLRVADPDVRVERSAPAWRAGDAPAPAGSPRAS